MVSVDDRAFERITDIESRHWAALFFGLLLAYILLMVYTAIGYSADARLFPIVIGVPLALLIVVQLFLLEFGERLGIQSVDLFEGIQQLSEVEEGEEVSAAESARWEFEMILWSLATVVLIWTVGHILTLVLLVFGFIYAYERDLRRATIATVITFLFVYVLFIAILDANLWGGILNPGGLLP